MSARFALESAVGQVVCLRTFALMGLWRQFRWHNERYDDALTVSTARTTHWVHSALGSGYKARILVNRP